jgi:hypothetical protein
MRKTSCGTEIAVHPGVVKRTDSTATIRQKTVLKGKLYDKLLKNKIIIIY